MQILLGLGSNVGDRLLNLTNAIQALSIFNLQKISHIYESSALLPENAPLEWNIPFLNMAVLGNTHYTNEEILERLKKIEQQLGRNTLAPRWSPRVIDIDILLTEAISNTGNCLVPHQEFLNRPFALIPAQEIAPNMFHPLKNQKLKSIFIDPSHLRLTEYKITSDD